MSDSNYAVTAGPKGHYHEYFHKKNYQYD